MRTYRVLIVDDQRDARRVLRAGIESLEYGIAVTDVPSGEEAILVISRQPIDVLVSDIRLPGITGLELMERARVRNPILRYILITGMTDPRIRDQMVHAGADAYFFKPVSMGEFLNAIQTCLGLEPSKPPVETPAQPAPAVVAAPATVPTAPPPVIAPEPAAEPPEPTAPAPGVSDRVASLRQALDASCVALIDESGQILAQAGNLPADLDEAVLFPALLTAFGSGARLSHALGQSPPASLMSFSGVTYDLFLLHVGEELGLLVATPSAVWEAGRLASLLGECRVAVQDMLAALKEIGVGDEAAGATVEAQAGPEPEAEPLDPGLLSDLDALFAKAGQGQVKLDEADSFWDSVRSDTADQIERSDVISYDQARQLGLAPEDS